mgnify:CR=1 FL=1
MVGDARARREARGRGGEDFPGRGRSGHGLQNVHFPVVAEGPVVGDGSDVQPNGDGAGERDDAAAVLEIARAEGPHTTRLRAHFYDLGAAGFVQQCSECHTGGGWSEKDRDGVRLIVMNRRAEEIAARLGVSRAALYRYEKGEVIKLDTIKRLAELLKISPLSLLGIGVEYYNRPIGYFERIRQTEETADQILQLFGSICYLTTSDAYDSALSEVFDEAAEQAGAERIAMRSVAEQVMGILDVCMHARACVSVVGVI